MDGTLLLAGGTAALVCCGYLESFRHNRNLSRIPIRIHINGTRGKSGVTRLVAAGLRAGGIRTCAKTTGTSPQMIFPDGSEFPVFRPGRANVMEQARIVKAALAADAQALVIECMALQPHLQSLSERKLVKATHGVITNARADHLEVMGPTERDVARALAGTVPISGTLYTAEQKHLDVFRQAASDRRSTVVPVADDDVAAVTWDELNGFDYIEHPDNVALALRLCRDLGVDRETALTGMWSAQPDVGVMTTYEVDDRGRRLVFVNGFAANDPQSTGHIWDMAIDRFSQHERRIAVFNCRADRPDRSVQLAEACVHWRPADHYVAIGTATSIFARRAAAVGLPTNKLTCAENLPTQRMIDTVGAVSGDSAMIMGMGNIAGPGMDMLRYFQERSAVRRHTLPFRPSHSTVSPVPQDPIRKAA